MRAGCFRVTYAMLLVTNFCPLNHNIGNGFYDLCKGYTKNWVKPCKCFTNKAKFKTKVCFSLTSNNTKTLKKLLLTFRHLSCLSVKIEMREKNKFQTKWFKVRLPKPAKAKLSCCCCCYCCCCCCCCCCYFVFLADL